MDRLPGIPAKAIDKEEKFSSGHRGCQGCAEALAVRLVMKALDKDTIVAMSTGCVEIISSPLPTTAWEVPWIHVAFENSAAVISGCEVGIKAMMRKGKLAQKKINFIAMGGDGATADIGIGALSGAFERGHNMVYVCFDNEAYMNTGIQRSSATPFGASTTTSPAGKVSIGQNTQKKNMVQIAVAHDIPYAATACPSHPFDLIEKMKKAVSTPGPSYVHILSMCPTGWRIKTKDAIKYGRLAVDSCVFPLYEVVNGKYRLTHKPDEIKPVSEYLKGQGRFSHLTAKEIDAIQAKVNSDWQKIVKLSEAS